MKLYFKQKRKINLLSTVITVSCALVLSACSSGYQGGSIPVDFTGVDTAIAISPETIKLSWSQYPGANQYNIYSPDSNGVFAQSAFDSYLFTPTPIDSTKTYQYSVSVVSPSTGLEVGDRTSYHSVQLLPHFNFKNDGSVLAIGKNSISVSWTAFPSVAYKVFITERLPSGTVNYQQFMTPSVPVVTGVGNAVVTGLAEGHEYCAIVAASYLDSKTDLPDASALFTGDIGTKFSSDAYMKSPVTVNGITTNTGPFVGSIIANTQHCVRTLSAFNVTNFKILAPKATFTSKPTFNVTGTGVSTTKVEIFQYDETSYVATSIGYRMGDGLLTSQVAFPQGKYKFFSVATDLSDLTASVHPQAVVELTVGVPNGNPVVGRQYVHVRAFSSAEDPLNPVGNYPEHQQGGLGSQRAGQSVAIGDFNCDGKKDIAIGIPNASVMANDNRPAQQGKVVIYYDVGNGDINNITPATKVQTITFDITSFAGDAGRNLRLGTKLMVGNFNHDTQATNQSQTADGMTLSPNYQCDDLAIASGYGPLFVLYGMRNTNNLLNGGLNYSGATIYLKNQNGPCNTNTNICSPTAYYANDIVTQIGIDMTTGDFNGDGYTDLAATSGYGTSAVSVTPRGTWVFRGSQYGLIAPQPFSDLVDGISTINVTSGPNVGFPFLPVTSTSFTHASFSTIPAAGYTKPDTTWGTSNFGLSVTSFHNAYYDPITKRVRDRLVIGNPNSNKAHACSPKTVPESPTTNNAVFTDDANKDLYWDCSGVILPPKDPITNTILTIKFGYAMTDIKNALRYVPEEFNEINGTTGDLNCIPGSGNCRTISDAATTSTISSTKMGYPSAIAISDIANGQAYIYYMVASPSNATTRDTIGADRNKNVDQLFAGLRQDNTTSLSVVSDSPCVITTTASPTYPEYCNIQAISPPTTSTNNSNYFGQVMNSFSGNINDAVTGQAKDTIIAIATPRKSLAVNGGSTYLNVGSVQLYRQNSVFSSNPFVVPLSPTPAPGAGCGVTNLCRFSDGFSNSLVTNLDYDGQVANNVYFGLGGTAGGPTVSSSDINYNISSDIVVGAPGYIDHPTVNGSTVSVVDNGAAFAFWSFNGTYRAYQTTETGPVASAWHTMSQSFSQESDIRYHQAISLGDINQDGIDDLAVRISRGTQNTIRIYHGSLTSVGVDNSVGGHTDMQVQSDATGGIRVVPTGRVAKGLFPLFFITGQNQSYLFSSGVGGMTNGVPTAFGVGGTPRKLFAPSGAMTSYLDFSDYLFYHAEQAGNLDSTLMTLTPFAHGDFNGDGYEDFAVAMNTKFPVNDLSGNMPLANCPAGNCSTGNNIGSGRVLIFYGGADNGFQTQPDTNGGFPLNNNYFQDLSTDNLAAGGNGSTLYYTGGNGTTAQKPGVPCLDNGTNCKIQVIHEDNTTSFGATIAAVPLGYCTNNTVSPPVQVPVSALAVQAVKFDNLHSPQSYSEIYLYKPACLNAQPTLSGLATFTNEKKLVISGGNTYDSLGSTTTGNSMVAVGNSTANPPTKMVDSTSVVSELVVSDQSTKKIYVYPVYTLGNGPVQTSNFGSNTTTLDGGRVIDYSGTVMVGGAAGSTIGFANGMASVGDLNGDGYMDLAVNMSALQRSDIGIPVTLSQGAILLLFGGPTGIQSHTAGAVIIEPSRTSSCYLNGPNPSDSVCYPSLMYMPTVKPVAATQTTTAIPNRDGAYERSYLSPYSSMNFSTINEGLGTMIMGAPGKDSLESNPSSRILQGGAFYVGP